MQKSNRDMKAGTSEKVIVVLLVLAAFLAACLFSAVEDGLKFSTEAEVQYTTVSGVELKEGAAMNKSVGNLVSGTQVWGTGVIQTVHSLDQYQSGAWVQVQAQDSAGNYVVGWVLKDNLEEVNGDE